MHRRAHSQPVQFNTLLPHDVTCHDNICHDDVLYKQDYTLAAMVHKTAALGSLGTTGKASDYALSSRPEPVIGIHTV